MKSISMIMGLVIVLLASCKFEHVGAGNMERNIDNSSPSISAEESLEVAKITLSLNELQLPDEWEYTEGTTLRERFEATAKLLKKQNSTAPTGLELMERYDNNGKPFVHSVWFNRQLLCNECQGAGADGYYTVVSVKHGLYVEISAEEMHMVNNHQGVFSPDKYSTLKIILSDVVVSNR
jgi:hypothetical protein